MRVCVCERPYCVCAYARALFLMAFYAKLFLCPSDSWFFFYREIKETQTWTKTKKKTNSTEIRNSTAVCLGAGLADPITQLSNYNELSDSIRTLCLLVSHMTSWLWDYAISTIGPKNLLDSCQLIGLWIWLTEQQQ